MKYKEARNQHCILLIIICGQEDEGHTAETDVLFKRHINIIDVYVWGRVKLDPDQIKEKSTQNGLKI